MLELWRPLNLLTGLKSWLKKANRYKKSFSLPTLRLTTRTRTQSQVPPAILLSLPQSHCSTRSPALAPIPITPLSSCATLVLKASIHKSSDTRRWPRQPTNLKRFMQTYRNHTNHLCYWRASMSTYSLINSHVNHGSCSFEVNMSSLMPSNSSYRALKLVKRNSNAYKPTVGKNSSAPPAKASARRKTLLLATRHRECTKKNG